jgi:hypothetical protein
MRMSSRQAQGNDYSHCNPDFINGVEFLKRGMVTQASHCFELAYEKVSYSDVHYSKYASFCGYARVICGDRGGLTICRDVARNESRDGDVFYNLAKSEWYLKDRKRTVSSLLQGMNIDEAHSGIHELCKEVCMRKKNIINFLPRNNSINNMLGKLFRKDAAENNEH